MSTGHEFHSNALERLSNRLKRTVFVGGIPLKSTPKDIEDYMSQFDDVESVQLPKNKLSGQLKGYAKVTMGSVAGVERLLGYPHHCISGLNVGVSRWTTTDDYLVRKKDISSRKVYVKFKARIGVDNVIAYFSQFGAIEQFDVKRNPYTGRFRDFGYMTFEHERSAKHVIDQGLHTINGEVVRCELSKPNLKNCEPSSGNEYHEITKQDISGQPDFRGGKLNNKIITTKTESNRHEMATPPMEIESPQRRFHGSSGKRCADPRGADKLPEFFMENDFKSNSSSSAKNQLCKISEQKGENYKFEFELFKLLGPTQWALLHSPLDLSTSRFKPTSKMYHKQAHETVEFSHLLAGNLRYRVRLPPDGLYGVLPLPQS
jgi:RNA recognition motif-containing protein